MRIVIAIIFLATLSGTAVAQERSTVGTTAPSLALSADQQACLDALIAAKKEGKTNPISAIVSTWDVCGPQLQADQRFVDFVNDSLMLKLHDAEARSWTKDEQSVIFAYAAIWLVTVGFVVAMFLRQQKLKAELARLTADLTRAIADDKAAS